MEAASAASPASAAPDLPARRRRRPASASAAPLRVLRRRRRPTASVPVSRRRFRRLWLYRVLPSFRANQSKHDTIELAKRTASLTISNDIKKN